MKPKHGVFLRLLLLSLSLSLSLDGLKCQPGAQWHKGVKSVTRGGGGRGGLGNVLRPRYTKPYRCQ
jgi:hypothetical protein